MLLRSNYSGISRPHYIRLRGCSGFRKIKAITSWPQPVTVKQLKGFIGLASYYRKSIKNYGAIAKPLTDLLKKDNLQWTELALTSFQQLKQVLSTAPILQLPDFNKSVQVECDTSSTGFGTILIKGQVQ
jgi:hypothetical protein